jgi:deferrochelatase/peroxidase EfeB
MDTNELIHNTDPIAVDLQTGRPEDQYGPLFDNLQGHILKDSGRDYTVLLFLRFKMGEADAIKDKIARLAVTSFSDQLEQAASYREWRRQRPVEDHNPEEKLFVNFFISANGYRALDLQEDALPKDKSFRLGFGNMFFESTKNNNRLVLVVPELRDEKMGSKSQDRESELPLKTRLILLQLKEKGFKTDIKPRPPRSDDESAGEKSYGMRQKRIRADSVDSADHLLHKLKSRLPQKSRKTSGTGDFSLDFDPNAWDDEYEGRIDAMISMALDDERLLQIVKQETSFQSPALRQAAQIRNDFKSYTVKTEEGRTYYNQKRRDMPQIPVEHFGFLDGISNPLFLKKDLEDEATYEDPPRFDKYNPWSPLNIALVKDPKGGKYGFGSYLAYLKLEQDIEVFKNETEAFKTDLNLRRKEVAEALLMGRFRDGTPVLVDSRPGMSRVRNNFSYYTNAWDNDEEGARCPLHAHIRKMNRRDSGWNNRIVRRGTTYGVRKPKYDKDGKLVDLGEQEGPVGLLFMSFQSNIALQFENILREYVMENSPRYGVGFDPIIGRGSEKQVWPERWGGAPTKCIRFPSDPETRFVTLKGGEYFFAPSINFLKGIDSLPIQKMVKATATSTRTPGKGTANRG